MWESEPEATSVLVPDFIPDELVLAFQAEAQEMVAASRAARASAATMIEPPPEPAAPPNVRSALSPQTTGQRIQAVVAVTLGYIGLGGISVWCLMLAQTQPDPIWWAIAGLSGGAVALITVALVIAGAVAMTRRRRQRRARLTTDTRRSTRARRRHARRRHVRESQES